MKRFFRIGLGGACALALVVTFAVGRSEPPVVAATDQPAFNEMWLGDVKGMELRNADVRSRMQIAAAEPPKFISTERIAPDAPVSVPPIVMLVKDKPTAKHGRHVKKRDICERHGKRKVKSGRYGWRCR